MPNGMMSDAKMAELKATTHAAALALEDDLQHIREAVAKEQQGPGEIRRLSNLLRRILVEDDLQKVAAPRVGKIEINAPDLRAFYRSNEKIPFLFMAADCLSTHGIQMGPQTFDEGQGRDLPGYNPGQMTLLRIEAFKKQRVLCFRGKWVSRADIIKYVANVGHGTHSGSPREDAHLLIRKIRHAGTIEMKGDVPMIAFNLDVLAPDDPPIELKPHLLDIALMHLISTAQFLTASPSVVELEKMIAKAG